MHWNYRLIDLSHENNNEPWVEIHEVFYEDDGSLAGYTSASLGCEDTRVDPPICQPRTNYAGPRFPSYGSVEEAKAALIAYYIAEKLEK